MWSLEALRGRNLAHTASTDAVNSWILRDRREFPAPISNLSVRGARCEFVLAHGENPHKELHMLSKFDGQTQS